MKDDKLFASEANQLVTSHPNVQAGYIKKFGFMSHGTFSNGGGTFWMLSDDGHIIYNSHQWNWEHLTEG